MEADTLSAEERALNEAINKQLGQVWTPPALAELMVDLARTSRRAPVLEPSTGPGIFLDTLQAAGFSDLSGFEIDPKVIDPRHASMVRAESLVGRELERQPYLVIGNPPYVRWKRMSEEQREELAQDPLWQQHFNSLCDLLFYFLARAVQELPDGGEMIMVTPDFWTSTKHAGPLREMLSGEGSLDLLIRFGEAKVFPGVGSSIIVWRWVKGRAPAPLRVYDWLGGKEVDLPRPGSAQLLEDPQLFESESYQHPQGAEPWSFLGAHARVQVQAVEAACTRQGQVKTLESASQIANGMVSGLDKAFRATPELMEALERAGTPLQGLMPVVKARDLAPLKPLSQSRYIWLEHVLDEPTLQREHPLIYDHLQPYKEKLEQRYDYGNNTPYWRWSFLRSQSFFESGQRLIFIPCKERITNKDRLRLAVVEPGVRPTQDITAFALQGIKEDPEYVVGLFSSRPWFEWVRHRGLLKGGVAEFSEAPLGRLPIRLIDWNDTRETELHDQISILVRAHQPGQAADLDELDRLVAELLDGSNPSE